MNRSKAPPPDTQRVRRRDANSFDPRYKNALLAGLSTPFVLEFESNRDALRFRARCQAYRFAVKLEAADPGLIVLLYRVKLSVEARTVIIAPVDSEFDKQLSSIPSVAEPPTFAPLPQSEGPKPGAPSEAPTLEDLMGDLESFISDPTKQEEI